MGLYSGFVFMFVWKCVAVTSTSMNESDGVFCFKPAVSY